MRGYYKCKDVIDKFIVMDKLFNLGYECRIARVGLNTSSFEEWWDLTWSIYKTNEYLYVWIKDGSFGFSRTHGITIVDLPELKRLEVVGHGSFKHSII